MQRRRSCTAVAGAAWTAATQASCPALHSRQLSRRPSRALQCFLSAGDKQLALFFHLPKELSASKGIALKEWAAAVLAPVEGHQVRAPPRAVAPAAAAG